MIDDQTLSLTLAAISPLVTAVVKQRNWRTEYSVLLTIAACALVTQVLDASSLTETWGLAIVSYYGAWKPTGIAPKLEQATYLGNDSD